jgi:hypothetical protein
MTVNASTTLDAPERAKMLIWDNFIFELGDWVMSRWFLEAKCNSLCSLCYCTVLRTYNQYNSTIVCTDVWCIIISLKQFVVQVSLRTSNRIFLTTHTNKHKQVWILRNGRTWSNLFVAREELKPSSFNLYFSSHFWQVLP